MSDDFDGLIEGVGELLGGLVEAVGDMLMLNDAQNAGTAVASSLNAAPAKPTEVPPPNPKYPEGAKYRVRENEWWHDVTTEDVMVVIYSTSLEVLFRHPRGGSLVVPMGMIDDFEEVTDATNGPSEK